MSDDCFGYFDWSGPHSWTISSDTLSFLPRKVVIFSTMSTAPAICGNLVRVKSFNTRNGRIGNIDARTAQPPALHIAPDTSLTASAIDIRPVEASFTTSEMLPCTDSAVRQVSGLLIGPRTRLAKRGPIDTMFCGRKAENNSFASDIAADARLSFPNIRITMRMKELSRDDFSCL